MSTFDTGSATPALSGVPNPPLTSPTRNKYFYGKLLDAHHLQLEQQYFLDQSRLINRTSVGFGVLCGLGLELTADGTRIVVHPGVALDGLGREIVVPAPIRIDPATLEGTDGASEGFTVCLCYHECETEPAPALVSECDVHERCVNGLIRERFRIHLHPGVPAVPPYMGVTGLLGILVRRLALLERELGGSTSGSPAAPASSDEIDALAVVGAVRGVAVHGPLAATDVLSDPTLTVLVSCTAPRDDCVVLGTVAPPADGGTELELDAFTYRRTVMSNDALFELILGLTALVERCCRSVKPTDTIGFIEVAGNLQSGTANAPLPLPVVAMVRDTDGDPVVGVTATFEVTSASGGSFDPVQVDTDAAGSATTVWTLGDPGPQSARVTVGGRSVDLSAAST
ncbi:MAG: hypothetical protein ABW195_11585 [Ilumatobacteraceae bacterium]